MRLDFSGECCASQAQEIKERLLAALVSGEPVECHFSGMTAADMSFFELLHAAKKSFTEKGREIVFTPELHGELSREAAWSGWARLLGAG